MQVVTKTAPSDQELLLLAGDLARIWVNGALHTLKKIDQTDAAQKHNSLALLLEFVHLERYVRANLMPNVDGQKQEQFIRSLEMHWKCELQDVTHPSELMPDNIVYSLAH